MPLQLLQALVLGIVQGLTEFLPISSTGHLIVVASALHWPIPSVAFSAVLELGSIAAVICYFWPDILQIVTGALQALRTSHYQAQEFQLALGIGLGTLPIVLAGLLLKWRVPDLEHTPWRSLETIGLASLIMALLLALAEWLGQPQRNFHTLRLRDGLIMGLAQALAIIPGVSRAGATLTAGLGLGLERATAAKFSFLLAIPAILLAGCVELLDVLSAPPGTTELLPLLVGGVTAGVVAYGTIAWLLTYLQTHSTWIFVWYRLAFGAALLLHSVLLPR